MHKTQFTVISFYNRIIWQFLTKYEVNLSSDYSKTNAERSAAVDRMKEKNDQMQIFFRYFLLAANISFIYLFIHLFCFCCIH